MKPFLPSSVALALLLGFAPFQCAVGKPPSGPPGPPAGAAPFSLSPDPVSLSATVNGFDYEMVTVTTRGSIVINNPSTFSDGHFFDTQAGTCWQQYEVFGNPIPAKTTCTIQVGFHSDTEGTFDGTMTVYVCTTWHLDPTFGNIVCDTTGASQSIHVTGTATAAAGLPDLIVQSIAFGAPPGYAEPYGYTVTVKNVGSGSADLTNVIVQGYYSPDTTVANSDLGACGVTMSGTLAPGATVDVPVGCSAAPGSADNYLVVELDGGSALAESDETNNVGSVPLP